MVRFLLGFISVCYLLMPLTVRAQDAKQLVGSWRVKTFDLQIVGEAPTQPFGSDLKGSVVITENGRFIGVLSANNRKPATNIEERAALLGSLIAYTGKFTVDGDRITTKVDTSWNEIYSGTNQNQVRIFKFDGADKLTLSTLEQDSAVRPDKRVVAILTFEREK